MLDLLNRVEKQQFQWFIGIITASEGSLEPNSSAGNLPSALIKGSVAHNM